MEHTYSTSIDTIVLINSITAKNERHTFYIATEIHTGRMFRWSSYVTETKLYRATREDINELTPSSPPTCATKSETCKPNSIRQKILTFASTRC